MKKLIFQLNKEFRLSDHDADAYLKQQDARIKAALCISVGLIVGATVLMLMVSV